MNRSALLLAILLTGLVGCGGGDKKSESEPAAGEEPVQQAKKDDRPAVEEKKEKKKAEPGLLRYDAAVIPSNLQPVQVVTQFMEAMRNGDDVMSEALLTDKARKATMQSDMKIQPVGSPSSQYRVGGTKYFGNDSARVNSTWTESVDRDETVTYNVVWRLRKQKNGWRIVGFSPEVEPGVFTFLNFETPDAMMDEYRRAEADIARRNKPGNDSGPRQARLPNMSGGKNR